MTWHARGPSKGAAKHVAFVQPAAGWLNNNSHPLCDSADVHLMMWMYIICMPTINITDARLHLPELIEKAETEPVFIERSGHRAAVILSSKRYEQMLDALEVVEDIAAFDAAMTEEGENISWAQVKADLGWG